MLGELFENRYRVIRQLGAGGMGVVYEAEDELLKNKVAIKTIKKGASLSADLVVRFQREANALAALKHPNLVPLYVFGLTEDNQPYMVMRYEEGQPLSQLIEGRGYLPFYKSLNVFIQVAEAMQHAHKHGILHRDLKPGNIIIRNFDSSNPDIVIIDFGIAMMDGSDAISTLTKTGVIIGTPSYMSPEQVKGRDVDERSDIYALGCIMFEALTGRKPYTAESSLELLSQKINSDAPKINSVDRELRFPSGLEEIIATALSVSPDERYQSMEELRIDLLSLKSGEYQTANSVAGENASATKKVDSVQKPLETKHLVIFLSAVVLLAGFIALSMFDSLGSKVVRTKSEELPGFKELTHQMTEPFADVLTSSTPQMKGKSLHASVKNTVELKQVNNDPEAKAFLDSIQKTRKTSVAGKQEPIELISDCNHISGTCFEGCTLPIISLFINRNGITPAGMKAISKLPHLVHLHLSAEGSLEDGLAYLADNTSLEAIQLARCTIKADSLQGLCSNKSLKILRVVECRDAGNRELRGRDLELIGNSKAPNLKQVYWCKMDASVKSLESLRNLPKLKQLTLIRNNLSSGDIDAIATLPIFSLKIMKNVRIKEPDLKPLERMPNLTILVLRKELTLERLRRFCPLLAMKQIKFEDGDQDNYPDIRTEDADLLDADYFEHEGNMIKVH